MGELNASLIPKLNFSLSSEFPASQQCLNSIPGYLKLTSFDLEGQTTRISKIPQSSAVSSLSFSPNSSQIAVASGNSVKIYDLSTFSEVFCYSHSSAVNSVIFDNFSQLIASGSNDKLIKVIRINNQELQNELTGHSASINSVMFNRSSNLLVSGSSDNQILLWDLYNNTLESKLLGHTSGINQVIFNQDSSLLASASNCIKLWETDSRKELFTLTDFTFYYSLAFTSNSDFLAGGNSESEVKIWSLQSRSEIWKIKEFGSFVFSLCFTSDSKFLITGSADRKVKIWNLKEKREELELMRLEGKVYTVGVSVDGRFVACGGEDEFFKVCDLFQDFCEKKMKMTTCVKHVEFSCSGNFLVVNTNDKSVVVYDVRSDLVVKKIRPESAYIHCLSISKDEKWLALGSMISKVPVYSLLTEDQGIELNGHEAEVNSVVFSNNSKYLISAASDSKVIVWDLKEKKFELTGHASKINSVLITEDDEKIISASDDKTIKIWSFSQQVLLFSIQTNQAPVLKLSLLPTLGLFASFDKNYSVFIWNLNDLRLEDKVEEGIGKVQDLIFDKKTGFLGFTRENSINFWNYQEKRMEFFIENFKFPVTSATFDQNGKVAFADSEGFIRIIEMSRKKFQVKQKDVLSFDCNKIIRPGETGFEIFDMNSLKILKKVEKSCRVERVDISPDNNFIVTWLCNKTLQVLAQPEDSMKLELKECSSNDWKSLFSEDSKFLVLFNSTNLKIINLLTFTESTETFLNLIDLTFSLNLSSLFTSESSKPLPYYNFLSCLSKSSFSSLSGESLDIRFSNLQFTGLHILSSNGLTEIIDSARHFFEFTFQTDRFGHSAIFYSIKNQHQRTTDYLLDYLVTLVEQNKEKLYKPSYFALRSDLNSIILNSSQRLASFFNTCLAPNPDFVVFGRPLDDLPSVKSFKSSGSVLEDFAVKSDPESLLPLELKVSLFPVHSEGGSSGSLSLLKALVKTSNLEIFYSEFIQFLILSRWKSSLWLTYLYTFIIWVNLLSLFILTDSSLQTFWVSLIFLMMNLILLIWEVIQVVESKFEYFCDVWNLLDVARLVFSFFFGFLKVFDEPFQLLLWPTLALNIIRGLTGFRAFDMTRFYISLIFQSLKNISSFLLIFIYSSVSFGVLLVACKESPQLNFKSVWVDLFNLALGDQADLSKSDPSLAYFTFLTACVVNVILMLNMLISILGDSFDEFQTKTLVYDFTEMAQVVIEAEQVRSCFKPSNQLLFLHVAQHAYRRGDEQWKGKVVDFRNHLDTVVKIMDKKYQDISLKVENALERKDPRIERIDSRVGNIEHSLKLINEKLDKISSK